MSYEFRTIKPVPSLYVGDMTGSARLFQADAVGTYGLRCSESLLKDAKLTEDTGVWIGDRNIGEIVGLSYSSYDTVLAATFEVINPMGLREYDEAPKDFTVIPLIKFNMIGCCACNSFFEVGSTPCPCIERSKQIFIDQVLISGLRICHYKEYTTIEQQTKEQFFLKHFGGAIGAIYVL